jgi:outer membrane protein OmpA-like peptidoglycan-associated protein
MAESLFNSLLYTLDHGATSQIAQTLGEPVAAVSRGLETSIAAVLAGMSNKSEDAGVFGKILDLAPGPASSWRSMACALSRPNSTLLTNGNRIVSSLFGSGDRPIARAIDREAGLGAGAAATLLAMGAGMVTGVLGQRIRDRHMTLSGLRVTLCNETAAVRRALPSGIADAIWQRTGAHAASQLWVPFTHREGVPWIGASMIAALALGAFLLVEHHRGGGQVASAATGSASRWVIDPGAPASSALSQHHSPIQLKLPEASGERRLLSFIEDTAALPSAETWFDFDRLRFDSGSAQLATGAADQLDDVAAIFKAYPEVRGKIVGYCDNQGSAEANLKLSEARANTVKSELAARGVSTSRLATEGYGEEDPVGDNSTDAGRAENRRVVLQVTNK